ncbi:hypothetical protein SteCoe_21178 [Stentor coeruleus]|uniref:Uncharacterized protein n=1 Tax=Stentor coeruleus TaxID=5963 RepID=A0A1R2BQ55_9CILI|nr:hypothetical protein SteCoe_21178 [Stentor coeruleus]
MDKIRNEGESLNGLHTKFKIIMTNYNNELTNSDNEISELELKCYMYGDEICIAQYDDYLIGNMNLTRKMDELVIEKERKCWSVIPYSKRPTGEFDWKFESMESINEFKKFYQCSKPYNEKILQIFHDKLIMNRKITRVLNEHNIKFGK